MKIFVAQLIPIIFKKLFLMVLLLFALLFSISLQAETRYLFPGDIIGQGLQAVYKQSIETAPIPTPMETDEQYGQKYPHLLYVSDLEQDNYSIGKKNKVRQYSFQNHSTQEYPNLLYVSDIEPDKRLINQKAKAIHIQYSLH